MEKIKQNILLQVFWTFFKISPVSFGGGFAMMPLMKDEIVNKKKWLNDDEMIDAFALAQSTPGAVGVNSAAFIGFRIAGFKGAVSATIGIILPTFFIVIALSSLFLFVQDNKVVEAAFKGIRPAVVALIAYAAVLTVRSSLRNKSSIILLIVALALMLFLQIHPIILLVSGILFGIISKKFNDRKLCKRTV